MSKILLTNHYEGLPLDILTRQIPSDFTLEILEEPTRECLLKKAVEADYFLVSGRLKIDKEVLDRASKLKMIQRTGVGLDVFDMQEVKRRNIPLYVNQGVNAQSVAEHTLLLMLACLKKLTVINKNVKQGIWKKQEQGLTTFELSGKTVGLIGLGNIGKRVASILNAFDAKVLYYDKYPLSSTSKIAAERVTLDELLVNADIISLHCPLTPETKGIISQASIKKMKDGVIIVNTARGPLINTGDLLDGIKSGKIAFAGLDVYEAEPIADADLLAQDNIITTPHIGGVSYDSFNRMMKEAVQNIVLFDNGMVEKIEKSKYLY